ncbi:MAG: RHS repeat-associated core domain-containing protein [Porphyromonadaceae bacterium]|nr:RHS repeat-associated core domain-containing protein [Porphyromonadaceae bacterium]
MFEGFTPTAKLVNGKTYSIISDHIGTPLQAIDSEGKLIWERELDIYGRIRKEEGEKGFCNMLYQGQYLDIETELVYNYKRYYSQETGAYISQDPIGLAGGNPTLYGYVFDSNIEIDPFGLDCFENKAQGDAGRDALISRLEQSKRFDVLGREVRINTPNSPHYRVADIVVLDKKTNKIHIIEVKTGGATRNASQLAKDIDISKGNGTTWGSKKADDFGIIGVSKGSPTGSIQTTEVKVDPTTGKILR